jgi:Ca-activated chloride channel homolog
VTFSNPFALAGLVALPLLVLLYVWRDRQRVRSGAVWATPALIPNLVERRPGVRRHLPLAVLLVALAALIVGVARPHAKVTVTREEATVLLALDTSRSMGAADVKPSRLGAAQAALTAFVDKVPKRFKIGLVTFSTHAVVSAAPTTDRDAVKRAIAVVHPGEGTALGDAVMLGAILGQRQRTSDGVVPPTSMLLISDGKRDGGRFSTQQAAARARANHVPVYTVAIGTANGVVEHKLPGGLTETLRVPTSPQELQRLSASTGGQSFTSASADNLKHVYEQLGSRLGHKKQNRELTDLFAGGGALLMLVGGGLSALWFRRFP